MAYKDRAKMIAYNNQYNSKAYDRINLTIPKGEKEQIKKAAEAVGESVNAYIKKAIDNRMKSEE